MCTSIALIFVVGLFVADALVADVLLAVFFVGDFFDAVFVVATAVSERVVCLSRETRAGCMKFAHPTPVGTTPYL
ncbi:MAG: hypothetical protein ACJ8AD_16165, partial [Gemmatimonadaceae bacterium]